MAAAYVVFASVYVAVLLSYLVARLVSTALRDNSQEPAFAVVEEEVGCSVEEHDRKSNDIVEYCEYDQKQSVCIEGEIKKKKKYSPEVEAKNLSWGSCCGEETEADMNEDVSSDGDEWERIERTELERDFAKAMNFVESRDKESVLRSKLGSDMIMQLDALQKAALEGPCNLPQPMPFNLSARAKWNAWHKLGSLNQEEAMKQYITLLSNNVTGWNHDMLPAEFAQLEHSMMNLKQDEKNSSDAVLSKPLSSPLICEDEREPEATSVKERNHPCRSPVSINKLACLLICCLIASQIVGGRPPETPAK